MEEAVSRRYAGTCEHWFMGEAICSRAVLSPDGAGLRFLYVRTHQTG